MSSVRKSLVLALLGLAPAALAADIHVPGDYLTISAALTAARSGDVIVIEPGSYPENLDVPAMTITFRGAGDGVIVNGQGVGSVFRVASGATVTFENLTITAGHAANGGGIYADPDATVAVLSCTLFDNRADAGGGGLYFRGGQLEISGSNFHSNTAGTGGGAHILGYATLRSNSFTSNSAQSGGGLYVRLGNQTATDCTFETNYATTDGGGIFVASGHFTLERARLLTNDADRGGGLFTSEGIASLSNSLLASNTARRVGASFCNTYRVHLLNCTLADNLDSRDTSIYTGRDAASYLFNSIASNGAKTFGGAGWTNFRNSIYDDAPADPDALGNFSADPAFVDPSGGDYRLAAGSPAIDAGDSRARLYYLDVLSFQADLDGDYRVTDDPATDGIGVAVWGLTIDIGALEFQPAAGGCPADLDGDGDADVNDFFRYLDLFSVGCG